MLICFSLLMHSGYNCHHLLGMEACCYQSCWLHTKLKYYRKSLFNRLTIIPQQDKTNTKKETKKVKRVVSNRYSLFDIQNHATGVKDGAWDIFFYFLFSCQIKYFLIFTLTIYFNLILISPYCCFAQLSYFIYFIEPGSMSS